MKNEEFATAYMRRYLSFMLLALSFSASSLLTACSADDDAEPQAQTGVLRLTTSVTAFDDALSPLGRAEEATRTNIAGNAFAVGDRIKLKIICPYSDRTEFGETTYSETADGLWLLKWNGSDWTPLEASDEVDMNGTYKYSGSYSLFGRYEAQQTPYIYTASTWSENVIFLSNGTRYSQYNYVFEADQTAEADYLKSDLLWAQSYMQTGSYNVHLAFQHVMACLKIDISALSLSDKTVVTLEGMPDIDQREVVVGDYYAAKSKVNSGYGYQQKCSCTKDDNGKVLGVAIINDAAKTAQVKALNGTDIQNSGVYTAHRDGNYYYLIVPPCTLPTNTNAVFWIRDGEKRYSYTLQQTTFEQGYQYPINITLP